MEVRKGLIKTTECLLFDEFLIKIILTLKTSKYWKKN